MKFQIGNDKEFFGGNMEVWLLETYYGEGAEDNYEEMYLHLPGTDIWITDEGYSDECLANQNFTQLFWDRIGTEHNFTFLGEL